MERNNSDYYYNLARKNIRKYRILKNISIQELADMCDLTCQYMRDLECLKIIKRPRLDTLALIAEALNVDIKDLFIGEEAVKK